MNYKITIDVSVEILEYELKKGEIMEYQIYRIVKDTTFDLALEEAKFMVSTLPDKEYNHVEMQINNIEKI